MEISANFTFLKQELPHAAESASFAERHVYGDPRASCFHARHALEHLLKRVYTRISDLAVVPYRQDQSPRLDFWGTDVRNDTREGDTLWVNDNTSHFSSSSTVS